MSTFEDREKAFENQFEHDEELEFKITSRMAHMLGLWAAEQLGLKGKDAETYAREAMNIEIAQAGRAALANKTHTDFVAKGLNISKHRIEHEMDACYKEAREKLAGPSPKTIH